MVMNQFPSSENGSSSRKITLVILGVVMLLGLAAGWYFFVWQGGGYSPATPQAENPAQPEPEPYRIRRIQVKEENLKTNEEGRISSSQDSDRFEFETEAEKELILTY